MEPARSILTINAPASDRSELALAGRDRAIPFEKGRVAGFVDVYRMPLRACGIFGEHRARTDGPGLEIAAAIRTHVAERT